ncbi:MAG: nuclear transport factor 2 family protein [Spirosomataceae bacterium]
MEKISIEKRLQILEDKEAIKDLTYQYAFYINQGWNDIEINAESLMNIFTADAVWESQIMQIKVSGINDIINSLKEETKSVLFAMHSYSNPIIKIDDKTAKGNWLFWVISKMEKDKTNQVYMSQDIEYTNTSQGWRINSVRLNFGDIVKNKI